MRRWAVFWAMVVRVCCHGRRSEDRTLWLFAFDVCGQTPPRPSPTGGGGCLLEGSGCGAPRRMSFCFCRCVGFLHPLPSPPPLCRGGGSFVAVAWSGAPRRTLWFAALWLSAADVNASCEGEGNAVVVGMGFVVVIVAGSGRGCGAGSAFFSGCCG